MLSFIPYTFMLHYNSLSSTLNFTFIWYFVIRSYKSRDGAHSRPPHREHRPETRCKFTVDAVLHTAVQLLIIHDLNL
jgi:hypothetical protein